MWYEDGSRYIGQWNQNKKCGEGHIITPQGQQQLENHEFKSNIIDAEKGVNAFKGVFGNNNAFGPNYADNLVDLRKYSIQQS